jgi:hypothetical protein
MPADRRERRLLIVDEPHFGRVRYEAYKKDIDRTLLRETLKLTPAQRLQRLQDVVQTMARLRGGHARQGEPKT